MSGREKNAYATATARASARRKRRRRAANKLSIFGVIGVVILFCAVLLIQISSSKQKLEELVIEEQQLEEERDEQLELAEELKERQVYVQTKMYVEEVARDLGLIYPDEVIFKPTDD